MNGRMQMTAGYTGRCALANHSRLLHSGDVLKRAVNLSLNLGLDSYDAVVVGLAGFLHDVGHVPFSHTGETIYREMGPELGKQLGLSGPFDHEEYSWKLITSDPIAEILDSYQFDPDDVVSVLRGDNSRYGKYSAIVDLADRHAYLIRDPYAAFSSLQLSRRASRIVQNTENNLFMHNGELYTTDHRSFLGILKLRVRLYAEASLHEATLLADAVLADETRRV